MKQLCIFLIAMILSSCLVGHSRQSSFKTNSKIKENENGHSTKEVLEKIASTFKNPVNPNSKILWEGWIKYFHYETYRTIKRPSEFFVNNAYFKQRVTKEGLNAKDKGIFSNVTSKYSFYGALLAQSFNILSERNLNFGKTVETLDIDMIKPLDPSEPLKGSIKDLGSFNEGACISILMLIPLNYNKDFLPLKESNETKNDSWIICFESNNDKEKFFTTLVTYKLLRQKEQGIELALRQSQVNGMKPPSTPKYERYSGSDAKPEIDGYLMLISDWSQCSLKCGGGESLQQWRCIPPKTGGKPCVGELIRKKKCNSNPCPGVSTKKEVDNTDEKEEEPITFKPIFKSMPFIDRPQQDIPCVIKENDILWEKKDKESGFTVKVPGRILMNNRTVSLFEDSSYENAVFAFNLADSELVPVKEEYCCFFLQSQNKRYKVCALADCGTEGDPKFLKGWQYSFSLFQKKCYNRIKAEKFSEEELEKEKSALEPSSTLASMNIEESEVGEREKIIEGRLNQDSDLFLDKKITKNQQSALKALTRELNLEERLKREEMMKAKEETKVLIKKMNFEKEKKEKLDEAIEERESQDIKLREQRDTEHQADNIIYQTEEEINKKRLALKKKIMEIRKMTERRNRLIENKINLIRGKMTEEIVQASKIGQTKTCKDNKVKKEDRVKYCDENIINDYQRNLDCKTEQDFCYICCETEFGPVQYNNRAKCYDMCDEGSNQNKIESKPRGDWLWKKNS